MSWRMELHMPGDDIAPLPPGAFILTHGDSWVSKLIRFGERLRGRGGYWNHAALAYSPWRIAEALGQGVVLSDIEKYEDTTYLVVWNDSIVRREVDHILAFADSVLDARTKYGYLEIVSLGLTMLFRLGKRRVLFGMSGSMICSGFVGEALTRLGAIFDIPPGYLTPADLADWAMMRAIGSNDMLVRDV